MEGYCSAYAGAYGLSAVSLRFSNVYGPGSLHKGSIVAAMSSSASWPVRSLVVYGDGHQVRDFIYIGDVCRGIMAALTSAVTGPLQLGSGDADQRQ